MKSNIAKWAVVFKSICNNSIAQCPNCNSTNINYEFRAKPDRIGYALMSCEKCGANITISRVEFPENVKTKIF